MNVLLAVLVVAAVSVPTDDVYPIEIRADHASISWTVELNGTGRCFAKAWIGRMGDQEIATVFAVELDDSVAPSAEGSTPLNGLPPGTYDLHYEGGGCTWAYSLVPR